MFTAGDILIIPTSGYAVVTFWDGATGNAWNGSSFVADTPSSRLAGGVTIPPASPTTGVYLNTTMGTFGCAVPSGAVKATLLATVYQTATSTPAIGDIVPANKIFSGQAVNIEGVDQQLATATATVNYDNMAAAATSAAAADTSAMAAAASASTAVSQTTPTAINNSVWTEAAYQDVIIGANSQPTTGRSGQLPG
jgi:hypothetical protein